MSNNIIQLNQELIHNELLAAEILTTETAVIRTNFAAESVSQI